MGFLIRMTICLAIAILFIPADEIETRKLADGHTITLLEAFGLASSVYTDAKGFCSRNPEACDTGHVVASTFGAKARTGARWIYSYFDPHAGQPQEAAPAAIQPMPPAIAPATPPKREAAPLLTGSIKPSRARPGLEADLAPSPKHDGKRGPAARPIPDPPARRPS